VSSYYPVDEKFNNITSFLKRYGYDENEDYSKENLTPETLWVSLKSLVNILFPDIHIPGTF
jgi:hypothetical protein